MERKNVLIVEDSIPVVASYLQILECMRLDLTPLVAPSYGTAKGFIGSEKIDLIILDLCLPDALAADILPELRRELPEIPIFIVTGRLEELDQDKANDFGVTHIFPKPIHVRAFTQAVHYSLGGQRGYL